MTKRKVLALVLALILIDPAFLISASAEEVNLDDLFGLASEQTVKTATLFPLSARRSPGTISVLTQKQIENYGAVSVDEALSLLPGMDVRMMPMGFAAFLRGFGDSPFQEGMQFLMNGHLYNSPDKGGSSANPGYNSFPIPVEMVKQVEVVRDPVSALYGPNAFYGAINVVPKSGKDLKNGGSASIRASNNSNGRDLQRYALLYGGDKQDWDWTFSGDFTKQRGQLKELKDGLNFDTNLATKLSYKKLDVSWFSRIGETGPFRWNLTERDTQRVEQNINLVGADYTKDFSDKVSLKFKSSYLTRQGSNCAVCHNSDQTKLTSPKEDRESFNRFYEQMHVNLEPKDGHQFTLGTELMYDMEHMDAGVLSIPKLDARTYSGFFQYLTNVRENLTATVGVRQDHSDWSNTGGLTSPRAQIVYSPVERTTLRAGYSRAHRVPTFHDLYLFMRFAPINAFNFFMMGNPGLKPETIDSFSLGGDQWITHNLVLRANGYYNVVSNQITKKLAFAPEIAANLPNGRLPNGDAVTPFDIAMRWVNNPANALILGGELELAYKPASFLDLNFNYNYKTISFTSDPTQALGGREPPNAPRQMFGAGITATPIDTIMLNVTGRYRSPFFGAYFRQGLNQGPFQIGSEAISEVFFLDFHARYTLPYGFHISLIGRNMLDQEVPDWKLFDFEPQLNTGRDLFLQLAYDFGGHQRD